jgi:hypothetical protein
MGAGPRKLVNDLPKQQKPQVDYLRIWYVGRIA